MFLWVIVNIFNKLYAIHSTVELRGMISSPCTSDKLKQRWAKCIALKGDNILSVSEKIPVSKFRYFGKYIIQLYGYFNVHVSGQRQTVLER